MSARSRWLAHAASGALGLAAVTVTLAHTDFSALRRFGPWAALVIVVEGARVAAEAVATRSLHGDAVRVPWLPLLRAHGVGYALANTLPAGRSLAETMKAVMLAPWASGARSAGVAATNQALVLISTGGLSVAWSLAARSLGQRTLAATAGVHGAAIVLVGVALIAVVRSRAVGQWVARRFPRAAVHVAGVSAGARLSGLPLALACFTFHRAVQAAQIFVLLGALGRWDLTRSLALAGAAIVGTTAGIVTPGQVGAVGASLALAAPGMGVGAPQVLALALVLHAAQFAWASVGFGLWTLTRGATAARAAPDAGSVARAPG